MFLAATNRKREQKLFKLWSFLIVFLIINIFYNWKYRSKAINTVIQQHPQGPGFFLSFSSAIFIQTVVGLGSQSCPLTVKRGCYSNTSFAHKAEGDAIPHS